MPFHGAHNLVLGMKGKQLKAEDSDYPLQLLGI
jgi:hypothetical protein